MSVKQGICWVECNGVWTLDLERNIRFDFFLNSKSITLYSANTLFAHKKSFIKNSNNQVGDHVTSNLVNLIEDLTEMTIPSEINPPLKMSMKSRIIVVLHWLAPGTFEIAWINCVIQDVLNHSNAGQVSYHSLLRWAGKSSIWNNQNNAILSLHNDQNSKGYFLAIYFRTSDSKIFVHRCNNYSEGAFVYQTSMHKIEKKLVKT